MTERKTFTLDIDMSPTRPAPDELAVLELDPTPPRGRAAVHDPAGEAWHAEARARWDAAEGDIARYDAPPLPAFSAPAHVTRELLGRFLFDRDTGILHDVAAATEACRIDRIRNGTFVHFASELAGAVPADARDCADCIEEG